MKKKSLLLLISCIVITQSIASTIPVFAVERNINKVKLEANVNTKNKNREIKFLGLGDWQYADLKVDYNTDKITVQTYEGKPHVYFKDSSYEKIEILDENGKVVYSKDFIGDKELENSTKEIPMKSGYEIKLTTQEPSRVRIFDDKDKKDPNLKTDEGTDIFRITTNGIIKENSKNREIKFLGLGNMKFAELGNMKFAELKVDYNTDKITIQTYKRKPNPKFKNSSYEKIEILNENGKVVYSKDFIGDKELENSTKEIPMKSGYEIKLTTQEPSRVMIFDDKGKKDMNLNIGKGTDTFIILNNGIVNKFSINKNIQQAYVNDFKNRIGERNLSRFLIYATADSAGRGTNQKMAINPAHKKFIDWIENNPVALREYLDGGYASNKRELCNYSYQYKNTLNGEDELKALNIWCNIWEKYPNSRNGVNLKIAIATALEFANGMNTWLTGASIDPIKRYKVYEDAYANNQLMKDFSEYNVKKIRNIVNVKLTNEDIEWLRNYIKENHPDMITRDNITTGYNLIKYTDTNPYGQSIFDPGFYGPNPTVKKVIEYGGVCGSISYFSSVLAQTFGVPAFPVGQPGHCAYVYLASNNDYKLGYDVSGWKESEGYNSTLPYMFVNNILNNDKDKYYKSDANMRLANNTSDREEALKLINLSIKEEPLNYEAWKVKFKLLLEKPDKNEIKSVIDEMSNVFSNYPVIKNDILNQLFKMEKNNKEFKFLGLGDWQYADLKVDYNTDKITIQTYEGKPHVYFKDSSYEKIEVLDENDKTVYLKDFIGDKELENSIKEIPMKPGYKIKLTTQETDRVKVYNNNGDINNNYSIKKETTFIISENGLKEIN